MSRTILRTVRLDTPTDGAMRALAARYEGNASKLLRQLIQNEAERLGIWPTNRNSGRQRPVARPTAAEATPPMTDASPTMEQSLVAAALIDPAIFLAADVAPADFLDRDLALIWETGQKLVRESEAAFADVPLIVADLERRGLSVPWTMLDKVATLDVDCTGAPDYAERVLDEARRRAAEEQLQKVARALYQGDGAWREAMLAVLRDTSAFLELLDPASPPAPRVTSWTAAELVDALFADPRWAVPGLLPVGLTILGGRPKVGKSWLALQIAIAVGSGGMVLDRRVEPGRVLYLALEDHGRRLQERTRKQGMPRAAAIRFETAWPRLTQGGIEALDKAIAEQGYSLAIVDTVGRAVGRARWDDYGDMADLLGRLQDIAREHDMALLVLDHHRKSAGLQADPIDDIIGSSAKSGTADAILGLTKEQGKRGVTLRVTGRDIEWQDYVLSWDAQTCCWQCEGTTEEAKLQGNRGEVVAALRDCADSLTATELENVTGIKRPNVTAVLNDLVTEGLVERLPKNGRDVPHRLRST